MSTISLDSRLNDAAWLALVWSKSDAVPDEDAAEIVARLQAALMRD